MMLNLSSLNYKEIWLVDFEYISRSGQLPEPVCLVALEYNSGQEIRLWQDDLKLRMVPPYSVDGDSLFVSYFATAELGCHLVLDWEFPANVLDLYAEFRCLTNGCPTPFGKGLLGASAHFSLDCIGAGEKDVMRDLVLRGGPWTSEERNAILKYCHSDVTALRKLLTVMVPLIDLQRALLRGRYMKAVARMEHCGVPIDIGALEALRENWLPIQDALIAEIDKDYGVFDGRTFKLDRWETFVINNRIPWPRLESGRLDLCDDTFREMARAHPQVAPIKELRVTLSQMRLSDLAVGSDGRNRCLLSPFSSRTSRNQPSNSKFIFGPSTWIRGLIKPPPGKGIAYIDWEQQEFGIAAALSKDPLMMEAYQSGDPYLAFAKQAGAVPLEATKESHGGEREQFKACVLAVQYGMGPKSLAQRLGSLECEARQLLRLHQETYRTFWQWSDAVVNHADLRRELWSVFGWRIGYPGGINPRSARNFPMQANGADMLRLACCFATERGVKLSAPIHDAILVEFDLEEEERDLAITKAAMREASHVVLNGFELRTETLIVRYPDRYMDKRGKAMWDTVWRIIHQSEQRSYKQLATG